MDQLFVLITNQMFETNEVLLVFSCRSGGLLSITGCSNKKPYQSYPFLPSRLTIAWFSQRKDIRHGPASNCLIHILAAHSYSPYFPTSSFTVSDRTCRKFSRFA
ncbi:hypothetical protein PILCRDRAFT_817431 [Piloderma croceum F 1598]|uniref:Uncharacterized protein n=1 Tax=Piloderma croceum (strain F 1598) TaxID=765440 RepID=A0A0C3G444_PILCF|nr:hypothetical protein PILCRDRAFT_817431 [Piloderma croceum F 1598]